MFHIPEPELLIKADRGQIEHILLSLVNKAAEAIPATTEGRVEISASRCELASGMLNKHPAFDARPGKFVCLEVKDNGSGMDEPTLAHIFAPFFSTRFLGRGLGLAAVQGVVRSYRGFIDIQSSPGAGTRFRIFLPAAGGRFPVQASAKSRATASPQPTDEPAVVLVVHGDETARKFTCASLSSGGYEVLEAKDGWSALEILAGAAQFPSLILLDRSLAEVESQDLLPILNQDYPDLRIVVISDLPEEQARTVLPDGVAAGFLQRPYTVTDLMRKVDEALQRGGRTGRSRR